MLVLTVCEVGVAQGVKSINKQRNTNADTDTIVTEQAVQSTAPVSYTRRVSTQMGGKSCVLYVSRQPLV